MPDIKVTAQWVVLILVTIVATLTIIFVAISVFPASGPRACGPGEVWLKGDVTGCAPYESVQEADR